MRPLASASCVASVLSAAVVLVIASMIGACKENHPAQGLVPDAGLQAVAEAAAPVVDLTQCAGCGLTAQTAWTFEGIYRDDHCTDPLAQTVVPACGAVPAFGPVTITYADEIQSRKAGATAAVTLGEPPAGAARFRKAGTACVRANEGATDLTPSGCAGQRVCRDANGALACAGCRSFAGGCPDYEETRMYASIDDPQLKGAVKPAGGGDALAKLRQCCEAIANAAKTQNNPPELVAAATQCRMLVAASGPNGNAPELGAVRALLAGRTLPAICAGL